MGTYKMFFCFKHKIELAGFNLRIRWLHIEEKKSFYLQPSATYVWKALWKGDCACCRWLQMVADKTKINDRRMVEFLMKKGVRWWQMILEIGVFMFLIDRLLGFLCQMWRIKGEFFCCLYIFEKKRYIFSKINRIYLTIYRIFKKIPFIFSEIDCIFVKIRSIFLTNDWIFL